MLWWLVSDGVSYTCSDGLITDAPVVRKYLCTLVGALYLYHWCLLLRLVELHTQEYWRCEILGVNIVDSVEDDADTIVVPVHPIIASASAGGQQWNEKWVQCHHRQNSLSGPRSRSPSRLCTWMKEEGRRKRFLSVSVRRVERRPNTKESIDYVSRILGRHFFLQHNWEMHPRGASWNITLLPLKYFV